MRKRTPHSLDELKRAFRYDSLTGDFFWLVDRSHVRAGAKAGSLLTCGYWRIRYGGEEYQAHRLAWLFMTGEWPNGPIDHHDLNKLNNSWSNLRLATPSLNNANTTGRGRYPKGVALHSSGRFQAQVKCAGKNHYLGLFDTPEAASAAYAQKAREMFGEFARAA